MDLEHTALREKGGREGHGRTLSRSARAATGKYQAAGFSNRNIPTALQARRQRSAVLATDVHGEMGGWVDT